MLFWAERALPVCRRNIKGAPMEVILSVVASARTAVKERGPLRGAPLVPRSASSLQLLSFRGGAGAPPFLGWARLRFYEFSVVLEVMPPQKNRSARSVARNLWTMGEGRPFVVSSERVRNSLRKERPL